MAKMARSAAPPPPPAELEHTPHNCHAHEVLTRIGDKWSVYVLHVLGDAGTLRFNELRGRVEGISQRMLTVTLRGLERDGLVSRTVYPEVPPRVEYTLTPVGRTLRELVRGLVRWSEAHLGEVDAARAQYDARSGKPRTPTAAPSEGVRSPAPGRPRADQPRRAAQP
jgi:DNA-binding HxlR family transcriptional regulator